MLLRKAFKPPFSPVILLEMLLETDGRDQSFYILDQLYSGLFSPSQRIIPFNPTTTFPTESSAYYARSLSCVHIRPWPVRSKPHARALVGWLRGNLVSGRVPHPSI